MPTGYTADIKDGISFEQFVWNCARAFGALVMMRDAPQGAEIPERFEPSTSYTKWADEARAQIAKLKALQGEEIEIAAAGAYEVALAAWRTREEEKTELRNKYNAMLAQVVKWKPPTVDHAGLHEFMADQLRQSIDFDCRPDDPPVKQDGATWLSQQLEYQRRMLASYLRHQAEEIERTESRNQWLKQLRESVPFPVKAEA